MTSYPMTLEQESMWLDDYLAEGPSRYLESWVYRLTGPIDRVAVRRAWEGIAARHDALRSSFGLADDEPVQRVRPPHELPPLAALSCPIEKVDQTLRALVTEPMDLDRQAVRATLLEVGTDTVILVVQMHHIVLDDWSLHIMEREFEEHYRAFAEGRPVDLEPVPLQPGHYALRQRSAPRNPAVLAYWRKNLAELPPDLGELQPVGELATVPAGRGGRVLFTISPALTRRLRKLCARLRVTPFTVFAASTALLLRASGAGENVVIGTPVSRRGAADCEQLIAPLSEVLPLRFRVPCEGSFAELAAQARARTQEAIEFHDVTIAELVRLTRRRGQSGQTLFRTVVVLDDAADSGVTIPGVEAERLLVFPGMAKYDLCFFVTRAGEEYQCMLDYAADRYSPATAQQCVDRMLALLDLAVAEPDSSIALLIDAVQHSQGW